MIRIIEAGLLSTVQDGGRPGYQDKGVPVCGAMDARALRVANLLVGNEPGEAVIEATLTGPTLCFERGNIFAVTGADMTPSLDGRPVEINRAHFAPAGSVLSLAVAKSGMRACIAFSGGLGIPVVLGSRSTCLPAAFGGYEGRRLQLGDAIAFREPRRWLPGMTHRRWQDYTSADGPLRVVPGPQDDAFSQQGMRDFFSNGYEITVDSNRQGIRLRGAKLTFAPGRGAGIISDGVAIGAIQVPESGQPIVMMADRQTTGGYAKIAHVITRDLPRLAQKRPGEIIYFEMVSIDHAHALYRREARKMEELACRLSGGNPCGGGITCTER